MSALVVPLASVRRDDVDRVGGKAAMLGALQEAGFPVPAGLCLTTAAFVAALGPYRSRITGLLRDDAHEPAVAQATARAIAALLADLTFPGAVVGALRR